MVWADWCSRDGGMHCGRICSFAGQPQWAGGCVVAWFGDWADVGGVGRLGQDEFVRPRGGDQNVNTTNKRGEHVSCAGGDAGQPSGAVDALAGGAVDDGDLSHRYSFQVSGGQGSRRKPQSVFRSVLHIQQSCPVGAAVVHCAHTADERWGDYGHHCAAGTFGDLLG